MSAKKKIAILASFPAWLITDKIANPGGHFAVWLVSLYEYFATKELPYEIHWISFHKNIRTAIREKHKEQHFHFLPMRSLRIAQFTHYLWQEWQIKQELKRIQPDLIHSWGTEEGYSWCVRNSNIPKVISMQGILTAYTQRAPMPEFQQIQAKLEQAILPKFEHITSESEWGCDRCLELAPHSVIHQWDYAANQRFFLASRKITDKPNCLLAGSNTPIKNVDCAIEAFRRPELSHITLYLAGVSEGDYQNLPENIIPLGRVNREEIEILLSKTWCLVHPSLADTFPNIVKEARVMRIPAIVTTECGAKQYIINDKSGYIIPCHSVEALVSAVSKATQSKEISLAMGNFDSERCRQALSADTMYQGLVKIYDELIGA